jgi:hypothetical protein
MVWVFSWVKSSFETAPGQLQLDLKRFRQMLVGISLRPKKSFEFLDHVFECLNSLASHPKRLKDQRCKMNEF